MHGVIDPPDRSYLQRIQALETANEVRVRRKHMKRDLKAGRRDPLKLIMDPPDYILTMKLWDLMLATPKYGRVKVNKCLTQARISPSKTLGGLTDRQRYEIVRLMRR